MFVGNAQITFRMPSFAEVLREQGKLTEEVLDEALRIRARENRYLGQILCDIGRLNAADIEAALTLSATRAVRAGASCPADWAGGHRGPSRKESTLITPESSDRLVQRAAARMKERIPVPARQVARVSRRPDLSAPFTVMVMTGLMSASLFLGGVLQQGVPLERVLHRAFVDPFGAMALALLAAAGVTARIGDI